MTAPRPSRALVVALLALAAAAGGVAVAAPGESGTIQGCYNARGALRVVDTGTACEAGESALTWNRQGEPGPRGPAGADGSAGPTGPAGESGDSAPTQTDSAAPDTARSPAFDAPVKKPKIKIQKKKPKIKIGPPPPGKLYQYTNVHWPGPGTIVYVDDPGVKTVARLEVPRGAYHVSADAEGAAVGPEDHNAFKPANLRCELQTDVKASVGPAVNLNKALAVKHLTGRDIRAFAMQGATQSTSKPIAFELRCQNLHPSNGAYLLNITLSAITVATIQRTIEG